MNVVATKKAHAGCYWFTHRGISIAITEESANGHAGKWTIRKAEIVDHKLVGFGGGDDLLPSKRIAVSIAVGAINSGYLQ